MKRKRGDAASWTPLHAVTGDDDPLRREEHDGADPAQNDEQRLAHRQVRSRAAIGGEVPTGLPGRGGNAPT
ncbi:MAG TPA: hypothetical protein VHM48_08080 [Candidatus Limnocylindrales bacterium]|nr:hypothetical protein [Candidatus Limnocylindrales bacterium]